MAWPSPSPSVALTLPHCALEARPKRTVYGSAVYGTAGYAGSFGSSAGLEKHHALSKGPQWHSASVESGLDQICARGTVSSLVSVVMCASSVADPSR